VDRSSAVSWRIKSETAERTGRLWLRVRRRPPWITSAFACLQVGISGGDLVQYLPPIDHGVRGGIISLSDEAHSVVR
jgi:hypothetical protein